MALKSPNPYSPDFGSPHQFFGRSRYIAIVQDAMKSGSGPDRSLLIEGLRGNGKTALLGKLRSSADEAGWDTVLVSSHRAAYEVSTDLQQRGRGRFKPTAVETTLSLAGMGSIAFSRGEPSEHPTLRQVVLRYMRASKRGLLLLIDEMQKIAQADAQELCVALNAAREERLSIILVMAGLPGTQKRLGEFERCTFMARSSRMFLTLFTVPETLEAVNRSMDEVRDWYASDEIRNAVAEFTQGHPYLMQLVGYDLYKQVERRVAKDPSRYREKRVAITREMFAHATDYAYRSYATKVLDLIFKRLGKGTREYLEALAATMDDSGLMRSGAAVAKALGKHDTRSISTYRKRMLDAGIIEDKGYGLVRFRIPYIPRYLAESRTFFEDNPDEDGLYFPMK